MKNLPNIHLNDLMLRLGPDESRLCALKGTTDEGWQTKAAWNPATEFKIKAGTTEFDTVELEAFVQEQQRLGRLTIGYLSYDFGCASHGITLSAQDDTDAPLVYVASFDSWLEFDDSGARIVSNDQSFVDHTKAILDRQPRTLPAQLYKKHLQPIQTREQYNNAYAKVQDYITAGDVYQINLTQRLEGTTELDGRDLFCSLSVGSQSNFQSYIEDGFLEVLSFSPERFIKTKNDQIITQPIKGTRPRGKTTGQDKELEEDLLTNPKERAELDMITDLMRNDLGEVCEVGTVEVVERRAITAYPTLWHANSTIIGKLAKSVTPISALCHVSPGGSITGCPKKRAIEIIDELEPKRRGIYTGSIFMIQPNGDLDSNIVIRTIIKNSDKLLLSVGGGIVHDSRQAHEYQESLDKAASFLTGNKSLSNDI